MGAELLRLLSVHSKVQLTAVTSERLSGERLDRVFPHLRGLSAPSRRSIPTGSRSRPTWSSWRCRTWSRSAVPVLRRRGRRIDLSVDYRLRDAPHDHKAPHVDAEGSPRPRMGCLSSTGRPSPSGQASPGCYPMGRSWRPPRCTRAGSTAWGIVIDGKSGVTGAGAQAARRTPCTVHRGQRERAGLRHRDHHTPETSRSPHSAASR